MRDRQGDRPVETRRAHGHPLPWEAERTTLQRPACWPKPGSLADGHPVGQGSADQPQCHTTHSSGFRTTSTSRWQPHTLHPIVLSAMWGTVLHGCRILIPPFLVTDPRQLQMPWRKLSVLSRPPAAHEYW